MDEGGSTLDICPQWSGVARRIRDDDPLASIELYRTLDTYRLFFARKLGFTDADDHYHDLILAIIASMKRGVLREPERLAGYARAVARNMVVERIRARHRLCQIESDDGWKAVVDGADSAETGVIRKEAKAIAHRILQGMTSRDRSVLEQFYVHERSPREICEALRLSETQFRVTKSRAKAKFTRLMEARLGPKTR